MSRSCIFLIIFFLVIVCAKCQLSVKNTIIVVTVKNVTVTIFEYTRLKPYSFDYCKFELKFVDRSNHDRGLPIVIMPCTFSPSTRSLHGLPGLSLKLSAYSLNHISLEIHSTMMNNDLDQSRSSSYFQLVNYGSTTRIIPIHGQQKVLFEMCQDLCANISVDFLLEVKCAPNYYGCYCNNTCIDTKNYYCNAFGEPVCYHNYYPKNARDQLHCPAGVYNLCSTQCNTTQVSNCNSCGNVVCNDGFTSVTENYITSCIPITSSLTSSTIRPREKTTAATTETTATTSATSFSTSIANSITTALSDLESIPSDEDPNDYERTDSQQSTYNEANYFSTSAKVGLILGTIGFICLIAFVAYKFYRKRRNYVGSAQCITLGQLQTSSNEICFENPTYLR